MSSPVSPQPSPASPAEKNVTPGLDEMLRQFWARNQKMLMAVGVIVLLAIVARGGWDYMAAEKERAIGQDFAAASSTPEKLKAFAEANAGHELAGVAWLELADKAYAAEKSAEAIEGYQKASAVLKNGPLADRTRLGLAMAQLLAGQNSTGEAGLKQLVDSDKIFKGVRVEAAYQLASLAHVAGKPAEVKQYSDRIMQIDPGSPWAQRVLTLQTDELAAAVSTASTDTPAATEAKPAETAEPVIKLNLPSSGE